MFMDKKTLGEEIDKLREEIYKLTKQGYQSNYDKLLELTNQLSDLVVALMKLDDGKS